MLDQVASLGTAWNAKRLGTTTPTADGTAATLTTLGCSKLQLSGVHQLLTASSKANLPYHSSDAPTCLTEDTTSYYYS